MSDVINAGDMRINWRTRALLLSIGGYHLYIEVDPLYDQLSYEITQRGETIFECQAFQAAIDEINARIAADAEVSP